MVGVPHGSGRNTPGGYTLWIPPGGIVKALAAALALLALTSTAQAKTVLVFPPGGFIERQPVGYARHALHDAGYRPIVARYPTHDLPGAVKYSARLAERHPHADAIGFSAGGVLVADLAAYGLIDRAVTVGAISDLVRWDINPSYFGDSTATSHWDLVPASLRERRCASPKTAFREMGPHPMLVVHSPDDGMVPFREARQLTHESHGELVRAEGAHGAYFEDSMGAAVGWLKAELNSD